MVDRANGVGDEVEEITGLVFESSCDGERRDDR